jgi:methyl-accepting chemotaxis protein
MKLTIFVKVTGIVVGAVMLTSFSMFLVSSYYSGKAFDAEARSTITQLRQIVEKEIDSRRQVLDAATLALAQNTDVIDACARKDAKALKALMRKHLEIHKVDSVLATDEAGVILARGHADKAGDSALTIQTIASAVKGKALSGLERGNLIKFALRAAHPVMKDGAIVGTVAIGDSLSTDGFVDGIKSITGLEVTIFDMDTRVSTTVVRDGKRIVGTKMDNPKVMETVLQKGEVFHDNNVVAGNAYETAYWPIKDVGGKIQGMFFVGKDRKTLEQAKTDTRWSMLLAAVALSLALAACGVAFSRSISAPLSRTAEFAMTVANGRLDHQLDVRRADEIGNLADSLRHMVENLKRMIAESEQKSREAEHLAGEASRATKLAEDALERADRAKREGLLQAAGKLERMVGVITSAAQELNAQVEQSRNGTHHQSKRVAETATAMEEMNATVLEVAKNAGLAAETSESARKNAAHGAEVVAQAVAGIGQVRQTSESLKQDMGALGKQAEGIGNILSVITDIADQTNLLALNAAIEAARAGDAGRGFAVVADEVRKLAEKTMSATKEVGAAIHDIQAGTRKSVEGVDRSVSTIQQATALAEQSGVALRAIVGLVEASSDQVRSIATAAEQQSATSEEINKSVEDISRISNDTAEAMNRSLASVQALAGETKTLQALIEQLRTEGQQA